MADPTATLHDPGGHLVRVVTTPADRPRLVVLHRAGGARYFLADPDAPGVYRESHAVQHEPQPGDPGDGRQ